MVAGAKRTRTVRRMIRRWLTLGLCAVALVARAADESLARYERVVVDPAKTSIYVGSVTMSFTPSTRKAGIFEADYSAKVFPYFFMSEQGKVFLEASDETLRKLARGETVEFAGRGVSSDGKPRRFDGTAKPTDATSGKLKVRAYVSKRIELIFDMTYRFTRSPSEK
jgi:hypothetical protein